VGTRMAEAEESMTPAQWAERLQGPPGSVPSVWDRMDWSSEQLDRVQVSEPTPMPIVRMWLRTEPLERMYRASRGELAKNQATTAAQIADLVTQRRTAWASLSVVHRRQGAWGSFCEQLAFSKRRADRVLYIVLRVGVTLAIIVLALTLSIWIGIATLLGLPILAWRTNRRWLRARLERANETRVCGCGYDTSGVPSDLPDVEALGVIVGPRICSECGAAWPLVPPPVV